jgi:hypothetical protein
MLMLTPDKVIHIYPKNEEDDHVIFLTYPVIGEPYSECKCEPWFKPAENGHTLVIHASFNGREGLEWANDILNSNK